MQQGLMNFQQLAETLVSQKKRDFIGSSAAMRLTESGFEFNGETFDVKPTGHEHLGEKLGIPRPYYRRMQSENPELLRQNVNGWMQTKPQKVMVRTLDGGVRAVLSNAYRPLDNSDLMTALLPIFEQHQELGLSVKDCGLSDHYMHIKATVQANRQEVKVGDTVEAGILVSNSEIGSASLRVEPMVYRLICSNGAVASSAIRQFHIGRRSEVGDGVEELLTDRTKLMRDISFWSQVRDVVRGTLTSRAWLAGEVRKLQNATTEMMTRPVPEVIEVSQKRFGFSEGEGRTLLDRLVKGGDFSRYGFYNAVTNMTQSVDQYDRRIDIERIGQLVVEMPQVKWREIAEAN